MRWSWLKVAISPLGAARHIESLHEEIGGLKRELANSRSEADRLRVTVMTSRETAMMQTRQIDRLMQEIAKRDEQLRQMTEQITTAQSEQMEYEQLDAMITQFEKEKIDYEKRLATLRLQLKDARQALRLSRSPEIEELPEPVDMTASALTVKPSSDLVPPEDNTPAASADWLQQLPDTL